MWHGPCVLSLGEKDPPGHSGLDRSRPYSRCTGLHDLREEAWSMSTFAGRVATTQSSAGNSPADACPTGTCPLNR